MSRHPFDRRDFLKTAVASTAAVTVLPQAALGWSGKASGSHIETESVPGRAPYSGPPRLRFAVIGINHPHIDGQIGAVQRGGGELASVYAAEPELLAEFTKRYPQAKVARSEDEILQDGSIQLVLSSIIPDQRAPLGVRVMQHGKDYMADKPGITTLEQLAEVRRVQAQTKRIYSILYSERHENRATVRAGELAKAGAIGKVVQTIGMGPHRISLNARPPWFWVKPRFGGILCDIGSHQVDQFLYFTGSTQGEVVASQVGNFKFSQYATFEDFGDMLLRGDKGTGYIRNDWYTPDGLSTWGDGRLTILGTEGYMEVRKNNDIGRAPGGSHLYLVDQKETRYIDCSQQELPYGRLLVDDVLNRTETSMPQAHVLLATELALKAEAQATKLTFQA